MFSASISTLSVAPPPSTPFSSPTAASAGIIPEPISLEQAKGRIHVLVIPDYKSDVAEALLRGDTPDVLGAPGTMDGIGELQRCLTAYLEPNVLDRIASFVDVKINVGEYTREGYRHFLDADGWRDLNSLIPGIAALGNQFNDKERYALYAGTLRLFGDLDANLTMAPDEGSPQRRIYNALFCLPAVTDDLKDLAIIYGLLDTYLDSVQEHLGDNSLYLLQPPGI